MNRFKQIAGILFLFFVSGCVEKQFYEDVDDADLNRFTDKGYGFTSAYINEEPWICGRETPLFAGFEDAEIFLKQTSSPKDTLFITWEGYFENENAHAGRSWADYPVLQFAFPIPKNFTRADFLAWDRKIFPADTTTVAFHFTRVPYGQPDLVGTGRVYFVRIQQLENDDRINLTGLFEGNIGDSIRITKGRFDYKVPGL